jgi:hypothetical protein
MKNKPTLIALALFAQGLCSVHAGALQVGNVSSFLGNTCWYEPSAPYVVTGNFTLPGVQGTGTVVSSAFYAIQPYSFGTILTYSLDVSGMVGGANHCVRLAVYFGTAEGGCNGTQVFVLTNGVSVPVTSASENLSTINLFYGAGCLTPGQHASSIAMISPNGIKTNMVMIVDDFVDAASGLTNHYVTTTTAIVPDIPPIYLSPLPPWFQGVLFRPDVGTNQNSPFPLAPSGIYDLGMQLYGGASNGLPVGPIGPMMTQSVTISNGLVNAPMNFDPSVFFGGQRWLSLSVRPNGVNGNFSTLNPPLPISPTPQAIYAYTAGSVATLAPGQAVTSLNGLTDAVNLQAGAGMLLGTNGNTLTISALGVVGSDRNLKTDFAAINPLEVLARLAALPVQSWRYTNELAHVRHIGPMAQDFMQTFGLGTDDKVIGYVDENGVALAAIQGLNEKLEARSKKVEAENTELKERLAALEALVQRLTQALPK